MNQTQRKQPDQDKSRPSINRRLKLEIDRRKDDLRQLAHALGLRSYGKVAY